MTRRLIVSPNARAQARWLAGLVAKSLARAVRARGRAAVALPGGDTPAPFLDALARMRAPWRETSVTLTDERWVDAREPASNARALRRRFLRHEARAAQFIALHTHAPIPQRALRTLQSNLRGALPLDVCIIGMGADGHIASLFPGDDFETRAPLVAVHAPQARGAAERISLSLRAIAEARVLIVLIRGAGKRAALNARLAEPAAPIAALARRRRGPILISWSP